MSESIEELMQQASQPLRWIERWDGATCIDGFGRIVGRVKNLAMSNEYTAEVDGEHIGTYYYRTDAIAAVDRKLSNGLDQKPPA